MLAGLHSLPGAVATPLWRRAACFFCPTSTVTPAGTRTTHREPLFNAPDPISGPPAQTTGREEPSGLAAAERSLTLVREEPPFVPARGSSAFLRCARSRKRQVKRAALCSGCLHRCTGVSTLVRLAAEEGPLPAQLLATSSAITGYA